MKEYTKTATKGSLFIFLGIIIGSAFAYFLRIILTRNLSVEHIGLFYTALNLIIFLTLFQKIGLEISIVHFINKWKVKKKYSKIKTAIWGIFLYQLIIGILYTIIIILVSDWLGINYFKHPLASNILKLLSLLFIFLIFEDLPRRILQSFNKMFWFSFIDSSKSIIIFILVSIGFLIKSSILIPIYALLLGTIIVSFIGISISLKLFKKLNLTKYPIKNTPYIFRKMFTYSLPLIFLVVGYKIIESLDLLILTYFNNLNVVGIYSMVLPTAAICLLLFKPVSVIMLSLSSELWARKQKEKLINAIIRLKRYLIVSILPFILLFFFYSGLTLSVLFGKEYAQGSVALKIILIGVLFFGIAQFNMNILASIGKSKKAGISMFYGAIINIILNFILIPQFGMNGAAMATTIAYISTYAISNMYITKIIKMKLRIKEWSNSIFCGIIFLITATISKKIISISNIFSEIIIVGSISLIIYTILILHLKMITMNEIKNILRLSLKKT